MPAISNKFLICLFLFIITNCAYPHKHQLKIYRKPKVLSFLGVTIVEVASVGGLLFTKSVLGEEIKKRGRLDEVGLIIGMLGVPSVIGTTISSAYLFSFCRWYARLHKPILIFDEEGFTYEKPKGWFCGRKDVRYRWMDVVSHWSKGVVDQWGRQLKLKWCYHIDGERDIVEINVLELDIPREMRAKVESLRQGIVRALRCD